MNLTKMAEFPYLKELLTFNLTMWETKPSQSLIIESFNYRSENITTNTTSSSK